MDDLGSSLRLRQYRDVRPIILTAALAIVVSSSGRMLKLGVVFVLELPAHGTTAAAISTMSMSMSMSLVVFAHVVLVDSISSSSGGR